MKKLLVLTLILITACNSKKSIENKSQSVSNDLKKETIITDTEMSDYATLTVTEIRNVKDGYTAILKNDNGNMFICTIRITDLKKNYMRLEVGDKVKIAGEYAESDPVQIFAKKIMKLN